MKYIAASNFSACISKEQGSLYLWGKGLFGEFSTPHRVKKITEPLIKVTISHNYGAALTDVGDDGLRNLYSWG